MSFSERMWQEVRPLFRRILDLPFNRELALGTLSHERFVHYLVQDAHYLGLFSRALAAAAARAPDPGAQVVLARCAHDAIVEERALHETFFARFGIDEGAWAAARPSPTCLGYGHWLLSLASAGSFAEAVAALLPCYHVYWQVGLHLHREARRPNPFDAWIETYADEGFGDIVRRVMAITDAAAEAVSGREREAMAEAYRTAVRYEWLFWDAAWRREDWPG